MSARPWSKFFWNDWQGDPCLRVCSLAAQGLWMQMLCLAAEADPTGYVTIAGRAATSTDLARLTGESEQAVQSLLAELELNGVFSRNAKGMIYSRRMVREMKKSAIARKNGRNGGNPTLCKTTENRPSVKPGLNHEDKPHKPEARSQKESPDGDSPPIAPPTEHRHDKRGTRIGPDWTPDAEDTAYARGRGYGERQIADLAQQFRDRNLATGTAYKDWHAAWRTWIGNDLRWHGPPGQRPPAGGGSPRGQPPPGGVVAAVCDLLSQGADRA